MFDEAFLGILPALAGITANYMRKLVVNGYAKKLSYF